MPILCRMVEEHSVDKNRQQNHRDQARFQITIIYCLDEPPPAENQHNPVEQCQKGFHEKTSQKKYLIPCQINIYKKL